MCIIGNRSSGRESRRWATIENHRSRRSLNDIGSEMLKAYKRIDPRQIRLRDFKFIEMYVA